ncbi:MAG: SDR family oxidoreductase [Planctomycetales bacterium]|nr:SDR family oxidoreductase [Planctomycetales bacterium]
MDLQLNGKNVLITGGASGIGFASARAFASEGANVVLWDQAESVHDQVGRLSDEFGIQVAASCVDVTDLPAVEIAWQRMESAGQTAQHFVHCAAIGSGKFGFPFTNLVPSDWSRVLQVNILGMTNMAHVIAPTMAQRKQGTMIFLASVAGQIGSQTDPPYSASKAANINFAQCLAKDLAVHGVRVNTICPGMVKTDLNRSVWQAWFDRASPEEQMDYESWAMKKIKSIVPLGRWQAPEDIANMIVFLSSDRACQVTGQTINVDGGFVMHW